MPFKQLGVELSLQASSFRAGLGMAAAELKAFGGDIRNVGQASDQHLKTLGTSSLVLGGAMVAGFGFAANAAMGFEKELSNLQGVSGATGEEMGKLRQQALDAGAATVFSAGQAVEAQTELAKAGVSTADILGGALTGALNLASAGGLSLADSATIAANAMTTFKLRGADVTDIADTLAAGANKSAADVDGMALSLQQSGLVASQFGLDLHETVGVLSLFAQNGLKGSDAGTSFKTMLQRLVPSSVEAKETMKTLGIDLFDAQGNFVGIANAAQQFHDKLGALTQEQRAQAMQTIFGSDAVRAAAILYQAGAAGVQDWTGKVNDSGYAADLAATKMDNLAGDVENLQGSIETALITGGSQATDVLRGMTQGANSVVQGFIALPPALQGAAVGFAGVTGGGLVLVGAVASAIPKLRDMKESLESVGRAGEIAAAGAGKLAIGAAVAAPGLLAAISLYGNIEQAGRNAVAEITKDAKPPTLYKDLATQINHNIAAFEDLKRVGSDSSFLAIGQNLNPFQDNTISDARAGARDMESLINDQRAALGRWGDANSQLQHALGLTQDEVDRLAQKAGIDLTGAVDKTVPAMVAAYTAMSTGTGNSRELNQAMEDLSNGVGTVEEKLKAMDAAMKGVIETELGVETAGDALYRTINRIPEAVKAVAEEANRTGTTFTNAMHGNSDAAIGLRELMRGLVSDAAELIGQWSRQGVQGDELAARVANLQEQILNEAEARGMSREEAEKYVSVLNQFPASQHVEFTSNATNAKSLVEEYGTSIYLLPNEKVTQIQALIDQGKIDEARQVIDQLVHGRVVSVVVNPILPDGVPFYLANNAELRKYGLMSRFGNVVKSYAHGGVTPAHVARGTMLKYAEPETGGEAFVPRYGQYTRSMGILNEAASWYGARVTPMADGGVIRPQTGYMTMPAADSGWGTGDIVVQIGEREVARAVRTAKRRYR